MISGAGISLGSVIPINDIRGLEGMSYSKNEKLLRCKLAAVYRLFDMYGWTQNIYNHISVISFEPTYPAAGQPQNNLRNCWKY